MSFTATEAATLADQADRSVVDPQQVSAGVLAWQETIRVLAGRGEREATEADVRRQVRAYRSIAPAARRKALLTLVELDFRVNTNAGGETVVSW